MKFYEWTTDYQLYKKQVPKARQDDYPIFYRDRYRQLRQANVVPVRLWSENQWGQVGSPYYNIHPQMASKLCRVDLTKIPSTMFQMPQDTPVVNIRFARKHDEFTVQEEMVSDNRSTTGTAVGIMPPGSYCHGLLMFDNRKSLEPLLPAMVFFVMDFDVYTENMQPTYTILGVLPQEGKNLEEILKEQMKDRYDSSYEEMLKNVMRLAVTIGFLANNPAVCEADVLARDRVNFRNADDDKRQVMIDRARRKGKLGYNIGNDLMFLGARPAGDRRSPGTGERELEWAHIRGGHPHAVRHGPNKSKVKIMWFQPTTVRDDLPFKPE